jgi:hypothetical protein
MFVFFAFAVWGIVQLVITVLMLIWQGVRALRRFLLRTLVPR